MVRQGRRQLPVISVLTADVAAAIFVAIVYVVVRVMVRLSVCWWWMVARCVFFLSSGVLEGDFPKADSDLGVIPGAPSPAPFIGAFPNEFRALLVVGGGGRPTTSGIIHHCRR